MAEHDCTNRRIIVEGLNIGKALTKRRFHLGCRAIPELQPNHFRRCSAHHAEIIVVVVLGHDCKSVQTGVFPNLIVVCTVQAQRLHMGRVRE